jgi:hypothetical protein
VARADMESAGTDTPIVATGKCAVTSGSASVVVGVGRCGGDPGCHAGRSVSRQAVVKGFASELQLATGNALRVIFFSGRRTSP